MVIKVEAEGEQTIREIIIGCPRCGHANYQVAGIDKTEGELTCRGCGRKLRWKDIADS
jgi:transcription elongation factor Elf1